MLLVILTLLCLVVFPSRGLELASDEYRRGRLNRRTPPRNESVTVVVTSSVDILASSLVVTSSETYQSPIDPIPNSTSTASTSNVFVVEDTSEDSSTTSDEIWWTLFNLGTITTIPRPTLELPSSSLSRIISGVASKSETSISSFESGATFPTVNPTSTFNGTSKTWNWNTTTSSASSLTSPTATEPLPITDGPTPTITETPSECPPAESGVTTVTSYLIIHTSTTTWTGDPGDYTPPYPPISTPLPCIPGQSPTGRFTVTLCDSTGKTCSLIHTSAPPSTTDNIMRPTKTVTLVTTDKNPAVVFPTQAPPDFGGSPSGPKPHDAADDGSDGDGNGDHSVVTPGYGMITSSVNSAKASPTRGGNNFAGRPPFVVIVQPGEVIIDDSTFIDTPTQKTSTVIVDGESFIIDPTKVVGVGATVTRPSSNFGGAPAPTLMTTSVGGLNVVYGPSVATIDGTVFTLAPAATVAVVRGQTITFGPSGLIFPSQTLHVDAGSGLEPTQTAVMGGELITAIGGTAVVIEGTTIRYGPDVLDGSSTLTTVVDGDTLLIAATGVMLANGQILGGITAAPDATKYAVVGGATVTQLGLTAVEIGGETFSVGAGASTTLTTMIAGHTLTIGPKGVGMSTWTLGMPHASTTTIMPGGHVNSGNNAAMTVPTATGSPTDRENGSGAALKPPQRAWIFFSVGVGCLGHLFFWL